MRASHLFLFAFLSLCSLPAQADRCANGAFVFEDANGNGRRDARERGLPNQRVSDGERIVRTDAKGRYRLDVASGRTLFLIKPAGYRAPLRADGLADTWLNVQAAAGPALRFGGVPANGQRCRDFPLVREPASAATDPLEVLVFGDPQPKSAAHVGYYQRDIVQPLVGAHTARLGLVLGDIVDDDLALYPSMKAVDARLGIPMLHAPGNHDLDFDAGGDEDSLESYRHAFGPDTRAWEEPQASFLVLDDVIYLPGRKPAYIGGFRERQFKFIEAYLRDLPRDRLLVLALHIHLFNPDPKVETFRRADRERLFGLLRPFSNVLVLSGHAHTQQHYFHGPDTGWTREGSTLHEYSVGAACGAYWTGLQDSAGIPAATMSDGTPNGYALLRVVDGQPSLRWQVARAPADDQMTLHAPKVLRRGSYPAFGVYANVYMGRPDSVVEFSVDGGEWKPMRRVQQPDPVLVAENVRDDQATALRGFDRSPEATPSAHLWRGTLPTNLSAGSHEVVVRSQLAGYGLVQASTTYRLEEVEAAR